MSGDRRMYDAANPASIPPGTSTDILIAGYTTGTPGAMWKGHWNDFPHHTMVSIDQGGAGAPDYSANVMDVEPHCWAPKQIPGWMDHATAERPTVYCDRDMYPSVRTYWAGPVWLAAPGTQDVPPGYENIIGIQTTDTNNYDESIIFDSTWPDKAPGTTTPLEDTDMINGILDAGKKTAVPFPSGTFKNITFYHDFTTDPLVVRVAVHSASKGYSQIEMHGVTMSVPEAVTFAESDVNGVSLVSLAGDAIGYTLS